MGWLDALFNITYAAGQFLGGLAGDLFGPRLVIPVAAVIWSLIVAAPGLFTGFSQLYAVRLGFGAAQASAYPNLGKITKSWFPLSIRTSVQGAVASFSGRAGAACAPLIRGHGIDRWTWTELAERAVGYRAEWNRVCGRFLDAVPQQP